MLKKHWHCCQVPNPIDLTSNCDEIGVPCLCQRSDPFQLLHDSVMQLQSQKHRLDLLLQSRLPVNLEEEMKTKKIRRCVRFVTGTSKQLFSIKHGKIHTDSTPEVRVVSIVVYRRLPDN